MKYAPSTVLPRLYVKLDLQSPVRLHGPVSFKHRKNFTFHENWSFVNVIYYTSTEWTVCWIIKLFQNLI
jgi:hypothetical protein